MISEIKVLLGFIGLGIEQSPSIEALGELASCDTIFYESFTSPIVNPKVREELENRLGKEKILVVSREIVEDGSKILESAKIGKVALVCSGDPMVATTHQDLRTRAMREGIDTRIIHGSSVVSTAPGELGLHAYNLGRMVTMTREPMQYTSYFTIFRNLLLGLHSLILLEWDEKTNFFLEPATAVDALFSAENDQKLEVVSEKTLLLIASRLGSKNPKLSVTSFGSIREVNLGAPPHVMVIPGTLHFSEREALAAIARVENPESFADNAARIHRLSHRMVTKYAEKTLSALRRAKFAAATCSGKKFESVFENVECYTRDAQRFLNEGRDELAVLSIGYAEGLLDSLRFSSQLEFEW